LISNFLQTILDVATVRFKITTVIIGGLALPAYNVARTTLDIDVCIYVESQEELEQFVKELYDKEISTIQNPKINHNLFTVFGKQNEAEIWLKPCDAFDWDKQMVEKIQNFFSNVYVLATEDYILTKIGRSDRSSTDISDIIQILIANKDKLDWDYLRYRLKWANLESDFKRILKSFELDYNNNLKNISKDILEKFKN